MNKKTYDLTRLWAVFPVLNLRAKRVIKVLLWTLLGALLVFGLLAYFWLPSYAKTKLESALSDALKRPVSIERISISPYTLSATVTGFKAGDVLSIGSLYVNVSASSLLRLMPIIQEVRLDAPHLHIVRETEQRLNISDLLEQKSPPSNAPTPQFSVSNISVSNGEIEWVDKVVGKTQTLSEIHLGLPFVANVPAKVEVFVEPMFKAKLNGAPLALSGKIRPFGAGHDANVDVELDGLDITPVAQYVKLPMALKSALLDTHLQIQFRREAGHAAALAVTGDLSLRKIQAQLPAQKLKLDVPLLAVRGIHADVFGQKISLDEVALKSVAGVSSNVEFADKNIAHIGEFKLSKIVVDIPAQHAQLGEVQLNATDISLLRNTRGVLNVLELAQAFSAPSKNAPASNQKVAKKSAPAWHWSVASVALADDKILFADASIAQQTLTLSKLALTLKNLNSEQPAAVPLTLSANVNERGTLAASGTVALEGKADLQVDASKVDLPAVQGWVTGNLNAILTRGDAGFNGMVHVANGAAEVSGDVLLSDFNVLDRVNSEDMLSWKQLRLDKLLLHTQPFSIEIGEITLRNYFAQLLVNSKGQLNLKGIVKNAHPDPQTLAASSVAAQSAPPSASAKTAMPIRIAKITLSHGDIDFSDEYIKPNYSARLYDLSGQVGALAAGTQSPVSISGKIDRTAPLTIAGNVDPFSAPISLNLQASAKGIDLPNLSGYSERYLGYSIEKGKLFVEVNYHINKGELSAENKIFLDQLTLGKKVENNTALDIPIRLAISLLQNSRGEIDLDVPIRGSLNDPQFSVASIVFKVLGNVLMKAVTSPFALIGSLFGSNEDVSQISFAAGDANLNSASEKSLQSIAKAMLDRPGLKIEVTGFADPSSDLDGLRHALLQRKLKASKLAEQSRHSKERGSLEDTTISAEEYPLYLEKVYQDENFSGKPRNAIGIAKTLPVADMESLLLAHMDVNDGDLAELADQRGHAAQSWLTEQGKIPVDRVFMLGSQVAVAEKNQAGSLVKFSLR